MRSIFTAFLGFFLLVFVMCSFFARTAHAGTQLACGVGIGKLAGVTGVLFDFVVDPSVGDDFIITVASGNDNGFGLNFGQSAVISEIIPEGWELTDIECFTDGGATATWDVAANEVFVECLTVGAANCTFTNVPTIRNIPSTHDQEHSDIFGMGDDRGSGGTRARGSVFRCEKEKSTSCINKVDLLMYGNTPTLAVLAYV